MSRNGAGVYTPPAASFPAVPETLIEAAKFNNVINDISTAMTASIANDGQTVPVANLPMVGFKHTGVADANAADQYASLGQTQKSAHLLIGTISGTNTITGLLTPTLSAYAAGETFTFIPAATNTTATTININSLGAKNIFNNGVALVGGELKAGIPAVIFYDGTQFNLINPINSLYDDELIINGDMRFDQEHGGSITTLTAAATAVYVCDGFYASCTGANVTGQLVSSSASGYYSYNLSGAASVTGIKFGQRIIGDSVVHLVNKNVTFSVDIANSLLTTVTWTAYYADVKNVFTAKTQIATGTFTVNSSFARYGATFNAGANAYKGIAIELSVGAQTSGGFYIKNFSLKPGDIMQPFRHRDYNTELDLCRKFYKKTFDVTTAPIQNVGNVSGALAGIGINDAVGPAVYWPLNMWKAGATITTYNPTVADANWRNRANATSNTAVVDTATSEGVSIYSSTQVGTDYFYIHAVADARLY